MLLKQHIRCIIGALLTGAVISFCYIAGESLENGGTVDFFDKLFYFRWLFGTVAIGVVVSLICNLFNKLNSVDWKLYPKINRVLQLMEFDIPVRGGYAAVLMLCWIPTWLSIYPGAFNYDAYNEWLQIHTANISSHHPVLHILIVGGIVEGIFQLTGNYNLGIATYTLFQMLILAFVFEYVLRFLKEKNVCGLLRFAGFIFYALSPVIQLFSVSATKDVLFSAAAILFLISIIRLMEQENNFWDKKSWQLLFVISALGTMIFRNNGLYIVILMLILIAFYIKKTKKSYLKMCGYIVCVYMTYIGPFYNVLGVTGGGIEEMLSVPIQQVARVHFYEKESIDEDDLELLYSVLPKEYLDDYRPTVSDFVKVGFNENVFFEHRSECLELWVKLGIEHPLTYINSFLLGTVDFWYPHAIIDGYMDAYGQSSYFDYRVDVPGTEVVICKRLHELYESLSWKKSTQKIPGMFLLISPGWYFVMSLVVLCYLWIEHLYKKMVAMMILMFNMFTVMLGPIALVRYVLIMFYVFPLFFAIVKTKNSLSE